MSHLDHTEHSSTPSLSSSTSSANPSQQLSVMATTHPKPEEKTQNRVMLDHEVAPHDSLRVAAEKGNVEAAQDLTRRGAPLDDAIDMSDHEIALSDRLGVLYSGLRVAAEEENIEAMQDLIRQIAPLDGAIDMSNHERLGALLRVAAEEGNVKAAQDLIRQGAPLDGAFNWLDETPLFIAAKRGHRRVVDLLLKFSQGLATVGQADISGQTPMLIATERHQFGIVVALLKTKEGLATIDRADKHGNTPLSVARKHEDFTIQSALLAARQGLVTADQTDKEGQIPSIDIPTTIPLKTEAKDQSNPIWIGQNYLTPTQRLASETLFAAVEKDDLETVQNLIKDNALLKVKKIHFEDTLLHVAAEKSHSSVVKALLNTSAGNELLTQIDWDGRTPLLTAIYSPSTEMRLLEIMQLLLRTPEGRAIAGQADFIGATSLYKAVARGYMEIVKLLLRIPQSLATIDQANLNGQTPLTVAAIEGHLDIGALLLAHKASLLVAKKYLMRQQLDKHVDYSEALANLEFINERYQAELAASKLGKAETKQEAGNSSNYEQEQNKNNLLFDLDTIFPVITTDRETKESKHANTQAAEISQLTAAIQTGDSAALKKVLIDTPLEQQAKPIQDYVQSQAIWTVLDSEAKPAQKSEQITLLVETPGISLLTENEQYQLPLDVALEKFAAGRVNAATVQKLQTATEEQLAKESEIIFQTIEEYAQQPMPAGIPDEKTSSRSGQNQPAVADDDKPITPQQLAGFIQDYRQKDAALQQEFSAVSTPTVQPTAVHTTTHSSLPPRQMSRHQQQQQKKLFKGLVHQLISERFIKGVGIGQGWVEEVMTTKATAAKTGVTFALGMVANVFLPGLGGAAVSLAGAGVEKGYRERQKTLSNRYTLGITSLKQLAMLTDCIERCLLHRYQDFLLQQNLLLPPDAMKTFINCLLNRMFAYLEKIDNPEEIRTLLGEKLIDLNKPHKVTQPTVPNAKLTPTVAVQMAENLVAGTSLLNLSLLSKASNRGTDALISCNTLDNDIRELRVSEICHSPVVTLTAKAEQASQQGEVNAIDLEYEGRHSGPTWNAGKCGVICVSREEAKLHDRDAATPWEGNLPIAKVQPEMVRLRARINDLEQQLVVKQASVATEKARADTAEARVVELERRVQATPTPPKSSAGSPTRGQGVFDYKSLPAGQPSAISQTTTSPASGSVLPENTQLNPLTSPPPVPGATPDPLSPKQPNEPSSPSVPVGSL